MRYVVTPAILAAVAASCGCAPHSSASSAPPAAPTAARPAAVAPRPSPAAAVASSAPTAETLRVKPNELGRIPVLMYHEVGAHERYDRGGLNISTETFRHQLELMYEAGWYPINMQDAVTAHIDVPAGKIPVVLTFDDGRATQFRYLSDGTMDPNCAVAIMERFHAEHPDWPLRATFYLLPDSRWNPGPFYQKRTELKKLQFLQHEGFELANHSTSHTRMDRMDAHRLAWEMAQCLRYIRQRVPDAAMDTMALPMGYVPRTRALLDVLLHGSDGQTHYENRCILRAWGGPTVSPVDKRFDPRDVLRIGASPGYVEGWIRRLKRGHEMQPYVSDGDPNAVTIPKSVEKYLDRSKLAGAQLVVWDDIPPKRPAPAKSHPAKHASPAKRLQPA